MLVACMVASHWSSCRDAQLVAEVTVANAARCGVTKLHASMADCNVDVGMDSLVCRPCLAAVPPLTRAGPS